MRKIRLSSTLQILSVVFSVAFYAGCVSDTVQVDDTSAMYLDEYFQGPFGSQTVSGFYSPRNAIREDVDREVVIQQLRKYLLEDPDALPSEMDSSPLQSVMRAKDYWACVYANLQQVDFELASNMSEREKDQAIDRLLDQL